VVFAGFSSAPLALALSWRGLGDTASSPPLMKNPLQLRSAIEMALLFQVVLFIVYVVDQQFGSSGLMAAIAQLFSSGPPGRATGGPVSAGRPYWVGENGPELFVPGAGGRIERTGSAKGRDVRVAIAVQSPTPGDPGVLRQSSKQVARAVRGALRDAQ